MKKGRHRRYEEARKAKMGPTVAKKRCVECGGDDENGHASWCLAAVEEFEYSEYADERHIVEGAKDDDS
ncbi:MAG: hypothetical protein HKL82_09945 [Acidimicrobiaceae bacterium]|nr:hypothetical protein [Acidimicrobiaceae bacterium]